MTWGSSAWGDKPWGWVPSIASTSSEFTGSLSTQKITVAGGFVSGDFTLTPAQLEELWNWYQAQKSKRYVAFSQFLVLKDEL